MRNSQQRQMRAVGLVTQTAAYFFLASTVPRFGSSANTTLATEQAAAAATANIKFLRVLMLLLLSSLAISSEVPEALTTIEPRRVVAVGWCLVAAEPPKNDAVVVMEAILQLLENVQNSNMGQAGFVYLFQLMCVCLCV